jgi:hypothetical protein
MIVVVTLKEPVRKERIPFLEFNVLAAFKDMGIEIEEVSVEDA